MSDFVELDAVHVAALAGDARVRATSEGPDAARILREYATELDEIADAAVNLDQLDNEIEHQLLWWAQRVELLEAGLTGDAAEDVGTVRELALYRGRVSGAHTMRRHHTEQRNALLTRQQQASAECTAALAAL